MFAWSRAGYGGSDPAELPRGIDYMHVEGRELVGAVLDAAGIEEAVLVGHSDGASIAIVPRPRVIGHPPTPSTACLGTGPFVCVKMNCRILIGAPEFVLRGIHRWPGTCATPGGLDGWIL